MSEDSYWGEDNNPLSLNRYTYCENDPVSFIDPSGHFSIGAFATGGISALINNVIPVAKNTVNKVEKSTDIAKGSIIGTAVGQGGQAPCPCW